MSPSSLCSGVVVSRVRTSSSIHRFRRRFHRSRFLVWWCTRLVVLWSPSSFPPSFSGQRWIGRWVSATPTSTMSSPTPPRPLWTKSSASSSKSNRKRAKEEEAFFWGRQNRYGSFAIRVAFAEGRHKSALLFQNTPLTKRGKRRGMQNVSRYLVRRARIRAHLRVALVPGVVHPDGSTARNRVVLFFLLLSFVRLLSAAAAFFSRGRRHYWCE